MSEFSIVRADRFIEATRSSGYKGTAAALAELVDNSLEANATAIDIRFIQEEVASSGKKKKSKAQIKAVVISDNGDGMTAEDLRRSLRFGDGSRFNSRVGLGRFGMGLPNASVSQARRVDVYSWRSGSKPLWTYLDVDEVANGSDTEIHVPEPKTIPNEFGLPSSRKGTVVVWTRCDSIDSDDPAELARMIRSEFGRIYRYYLASNVSIAVHGKQIRPIDPLFLMPEARIGDDLLAEQHGETIKVPIPLGDSGQTSDATIRFSLLPADWQRDWGGKNPPKWAVEKMRERGIAPSKTKNEKPRCISIVRANREIDFVADLWHEAHWTARWYRAEIRFQPELDEHFDVTHTKQQARIIFGSVLANKITEFVSPNLSTLKARAQNRAEKRERPSDPSQAETLVKRVKDRLEPIVEDEAKSSEDKTVEVSGYVRRMAVNKGWDEETRIAAEHRFKDFPVLFQSERRFESPFYRVETVGDTTVVYLNEDHAFYTALYQRLEKNDPTIKTGVEFLIAALALGESRAKNVEAMSKWYRSQCAKWSDNLKMFLDELKDEEPTSSEQELTTVEQNGDAVATN